MMGVAFLGVSIWEGVWIRGTVWSVGGVRSVNAINIELIQNKNTLTDIEVIVSWGFGV